MKINILMRIINMQRKIRKIDEKIRKKQKKATDLERKWTFKKRAWLKSMKIFKQIINPIMIPISRFAEYWSSSSGSSQVTVIYRARLVLHTQGKEVQ